MLAWRHADTAVLNRRVGMFLLALDKMRRAAVTLKGGRLGRSILVVSIAAVLEPVNRPAISRVTTCNGISQSMTSPPVISDTFARTMTRRAPTRFLKLEDDNARWTGPFVIFKQSKSPSRSRENLPLLFRPTRIVRKKKKGKNDREGKS